MEQQTYEAYEKTALAGLEVLKDTLNDREFDDKALQMARIASSAAASFAKIYQARSAREATMVSIITHAAPAADEFRRLVIAALPGSPVTHALATESSNSSAERSLAEPSTAQ